MMEHGPRSFSGERLREARFESQLTIAELGEKLGKSESTISKYENGVATPVPETLMLASKVLQLPLAFFFRAPEAPTGAPIFSRSLASTTKKARERAENRMGWLRRVVTLLDEHVDLPAPAVPRFDVGADPLQLSDDAIEDLAGATRKGWGLGNGPIANMVRLLESKGALVSRFPLIAKGLDAYCQWAPGEAPCVVLNDERAAVRSRHNAAHELGHLVMHSNLPVATVRSPDHLKQIEAQANRFASAFLMPADSFADDVRSPTLDAFLRLKPLWLTSVQSMLFRSTQLELVSERRAQDLWRMLSRRGWRRAEPLDSEIPIEAPTVLPRAVELVIEEEIETRDSLLEKLALSGSVVEEIACLAPGSLSRSPDLRLRAKAGEVVRLHFTSCKHHNPLTPPAELKPPAAPQPAAPQRPAPLATWTPPSKTGGYSYPGTPQPPPPPPAYNSPMRS